MTKLLIANLRGDDWKRCVKFTVGEFAFLDSECWRKVVANRPRFKVPEDYDPATSPDSPRSGCCGPPSVG